VSSPLAVFNTMISLVGVCEPIFPSARLRQYQTLWSMQHVLSQIEPATAIICVSVSTYRPLFEDWKKRTPGSPASLACLLEPVDVASCCRAPRV